MKIQFQNAEKGRSEIDPYGYCFYYDSSCVDPDTNPAFIMACLYGFLLSPE